MWLKKAQKSCTILYHILSTGFHNKWNTALNRRHPSIWIFIRALKDEQKSTEIVLQAILRGDPVPPPQEAQMENAGAQDRSTERGIQHRCT